MVQRAFSEGDGWSLMGSSCKDCSMALELRQPGAGWQKSVGPSFDCSPMSRHNAGITSTSAASGVLIHGLMAE